MHQTKRGFICPEPADRNSDTLWGELEVGANGRFLQMQLIPDPRGLMDDEQHLTVSRLSCPTGSRSLASSLGRSLS